MEEQGSGRELRRKIHQEAELKLESDDHPEESPVPLPLPSPSLPSAAPGVVELNIESAALGLEGGIPNLAAEISHDEDQDLETPTVEDQLPAPVGFRFAFLGSGQGGCRIANEFWKIGYRRVAFFNTNHQDFKGLAPEPSRFHLDIGGAAKDPTRARAALQGPGREEDLWNLLTRAWETGVEYGMLCVGLGGGTGTGSIETLARVMKRYLADQQTPGKLGAVVSLPMAAEGPTVARNAAEGFRQLLELDLQPLIIIDNAKVNERNISFAQLLPTANRDITQLLHVFNWLSNIESSHMTFDQGEFAQILDAGITVFGACDIRNNTNPVDVSEAIQKQLKRSVLADVDLRTGMVAACCYAASEEVMNRVKIDHFDAGVKSLARMLGKGATIHRGVFGARQGLQCYFAIGALEPPVKRLKELAVAGGITIPQGQGGIASYLGID